LTKRAKIRLKGAEEFIMITEKLIPYLEKSFKEYWNLPAFTDYPGPSTSYKDVAKRVVWMHKLFKYYGLQKQDKVTLVGKNCTNWAVVWFASVTYGLTVVPILYNFSPEDTQHIINHSDSRLVFISKEKYDSIDADQLKGIKAIYALESFSMLPWKDETPTEVIKPYDRMDELNSLTPEAFSLPDICDNEDLAAIIYTSGTTGFSKGVSLSHRAFLANLIYAREKLTYKVGARMVSFLPLAHAMGFAFDLLYPFTRGNHIHFLDKIPTPKILLGALQDVKPEVVLAVPLLVEKIYKKQLQPIIETPKMKLLLKIPVLNQVIYGKIRQKLMTAFGGNLRALLVGGAPLNAEVEVFFRKIGFPATVGYGMTECAPLISYAHWNERRLTSSGQLVTFIEGKIDSKDPVNIPGEILIKGEQLFSGYYKNPEATAETLIDGWLHTGDVGTIDKENFVYIRGRCKNVILGPAGENIYPESIEEKLNNLPYILETLVMEKDGKVTALVYPDFESLDNNKIAESMIVSIMEQNRVSVNKSLADFARVIRIQVVSEPFQKTPTQKIKRFLYS
jgi:long-chain acyl-CoA synthetase